MGKTSRYELIVIKAEEKDISDIYQIGTVSFSDAWREETIRNDMKGGHSCYFIAKLAQKVIGYGCFWFIADEAQLMNIGVLPEYRRMGAAEKILKQGLEEAAERHMEVIFLEVRVSNLPAQSLYRKHNFQTVSVRQDVYELPRENGYVMSRKV